MPAWRAISLQEKRGSLAAFLGYAILSTIYLGLPLILSSQNRYIGDGRDATLIIWSFAWWPHAIAHGLNPIVTHFVWAPDGVNLMWVGSVPGLAIPFTPLTLIVGPVAAYNVVAVLTPAFAAWTAFLLCRYLTRAFWPSIVGGLLFGMSSFELKHTELAHLALTVAGALVPLVALIILRFVNGEIGGRRLVLGLGLVIAFELLISVEILFTTAISIAVAIVLGYALVPARRRVIAVLVPCVIGAYALALFITAPFVYYLLSDLRRDSFTGPKTYVADALSFIVPTNNVVTGAGGVGSTISEHLSKVVSTPEVYAVYVGLPILLITVLFARRRLGTPGGRFVLAAFAVSLIAVMGPWLMVDGHRVISLPWRLVYQFPLFNNVLPVRLTLYTGLAAAVIVALWMAEQRSGAARWLLPLLAIALLVPNPHSLRSTAYAVQPFFTSRVYADCLDRGETILPLPIGQGEAMLWQAENGFRFKIAGGFTGLYRPRGFLHPWSNYYITVGYHLGADQVRYVRAFTGRKNVAAVVVDENELDFFRGALDPLARPINVGGVALYNLSPTAPSCGNA